MTRPPAKGVCIRCGGDLKATTTNHSVLRDGTVVSVVVEVPVEGCDGCGEMSFDATTLVALDVMAASDALEAVRTIPVYRFPADYP